MAFPFSLHHYRIFSIKPSQLTKELSLLHCAALLISNKVFQMDSPALATFYDYSLRFPAHLQINIIFYLAAYSSVDSLCRAAQINFLALTVFSTASCAQKAQPFYHPDGA